MADPGSDSHGTASAEQLTPEQEARKAAAIAGAAEAFAYGRRVMYGAEGHTVEEAARLAHTPGGPSIPELEASIRARRIAAGATFDTPTPTPATEPGGA